jgi:hypothetical protein
MKGLFNYFKSLENEEKSIINKLKSKHIHKTKTSVFLYFRSLNEIVDVIIPFFEKYSLMGYKNIDFLDFKKVAKIMKSKKHLTSEGYNKIININSTMNNRRP